MDVNSVAQDILSLLSPDGVLSSTVASPEYKLRATVSQSCYNGFVVHNVPSDTILITM